MEDLNWSTSSFSSANGQCVECARTPEGGMAVRDTKDREGAMLRFDATEDDRPPLTLAALPTLACGTFL
jgi:hypothetical protein